MVKVVNLRDFVVDLHDRYVPVRPPGVPFPPQSGAFFCTLLARQHEARVSGDILEVGVQHGGSALLLLQDLAPDERLFLIDLVRSPVFDKHLDMLPVDVTQKVEFIVRRSADSFNVLPTGNTYRFIHIDGSHQRDDVQSDILMYAPVLGPSGVFCMDDVFEIRWPQVTEAVLECLPAAGLVPFALVERKLYACSPDAHDGYLEWLKNSGVELFERFGSVRHWVEPLLGSNICIAKLKCEPDVLLRELGRRADEPIS